MLNTYTNTHLLTTGQRDGRLETGGATKRLQKVGADGEQSVALVDATPCPVPHPQ